MARRAVEIIDMDSGLRRILNDLKNLPLRNVLIGVQEGTQTYAASKNGREREQGISVAQYAAYNEFGTEKIPQRSFMRSTFDEKQRNIIQVINNQLGLYIDGKINSTQVYNRIGLAVAGMIQQKIGQIQSPPNAPYTIAIKKSSKPLIDFGQMIASIRHTVVRNTNNQPANL